MRRVAVHTTHSTNGIIAPAASSGLIARPAALGATIPLVLWTVWRATRRIHRRLQG